MSTTKPYIKDIPWADTWPMQSEKEPETLLEWNRWQKQVYKSHWLFARKYAKGWLGWTEEKIVARCAELERKAEFVQEEIEYLEYLVSKEVAAIMAKREAEERFKREGFPVSDYFGKLGVQIQIGFNITDQAS